GWSLTDEEPYDFWSFDTPVNADIHLIAIWEEDLPVFATDLFISEYVEGSSNNKAIELYNGTGASVNLSGYSLALYTNGRTSIQSTLNLSGILNHGETYVIVHTQANSSFKALADLENGGVTNFNGDDAIELIK